jgi:hypothetical protein
MAGSTPASQQRRSSWIAAKCGDDVATKRLLDFAWHVPNDVSWKKITKHPFFTTPTAQFVILR